VSGPLETLRFALDTLTDASFNEADDAAMHENSLNGYAALTQVAALVEAAQKASEPLYDKTFKGRLLRHSLSNDEIAQFVDALEADQFHLRAAVAPFVVVPPGREEPVS